MSAIDDRPLDAMADDVFELARSSRFDRFESLLARMSEWLNPILVKEARQALRSKQFTTTFFLMLSAGWVWSFLGLAMLGPGVYYAADGPNMFYVYHLILAFPLLIVAPYSAFHSLSSERQDRTYELVSITALNARQIFSGKLSSIVLQMIIYLSAIFPCLVFTYLLRGLDIFTILLAVFYTCAMSIGLSAIGLLFATLVPPRQRQIASSVFFALLAFGGFMLNVTWIFEMIGSDGALIYTPDFWQVNLGLATVYLNCFALVFLAARSQLTTVCQNRSTALRVALVVSQLSLFAWFAWGQLRWGGDAIYGFIFCSTLMWWFAGMFLTGESPILSERIKRELPQSKLGRVFFSWFSPGPGTGYMFAVSNMVVVAVLAHFPFNSIAMTPRFLVNNSTYTMTIVNGTPMQVATSLPALRATHAGLAATCVIAISYVVIYLGLGKLLMWAVSRFGEVRLTTRVLVNAVLMMIGVFVPWTIQLASADLRNAGYTLLQISNPVWTLFECCSRGTPVFAPVLAWTLALAASIVFIANIPSLAAELRQVRIAKPPRMAEEDAELALLAAGGPQPLDPWDETGGVNGQGPFADSRLRQ